MGYHAMKMLRALVFAAAFTACAPAHAQWQTPNHSVPIGKGGGIIGFRSAVPSTAGQPFLSNGPSADPSFGPMPLAAGNGITFTGTNPISIAASYPWIDVGTYGAVGNGTTINNTALQNALNAAASGGGNVRFPCGTFKVTTALTVTVAEGKNITVEGGGFDCTVLLVDGANGPTINLGGFNSSAAVKNMTIATAQAGSFNGLTFNQTHISGPNPAGNVQSLVDGVSFRGDNLFSANTHYWGQAFTSTGLTNLNISNTLSVGSARNGNGYLLQGYVATSGAAVQINITNSTFSNCNKAITYGALLQGLSLSAVNVTGCTQGVNTESLGGDQLAIVNSQFNTFFCGICIQDVNFNDLIMTNNLLIVESGAVGIIMAGVVGYSITGNEISGVSGATTGIHYTGGFAAGGIVTGNQIGGFSSYGIAIDDGVSTQTTFIGNKMTSNGANWGMGAGAGATIDDPNPQNLASIPTCTSGIRFSRFIAADIAAPVYNTIATGGGALNPIPIVCDGSNWKSH